MIFIRTISITLLAVIISSFSSFAYSDKKAFLRDRKSVLNVMPEAPEGFFFLREDSITYPYEESRKNGVMKTFSNDKGELRSLLMMDADNYIWYKPSTRSNPITGQTEVVPSYPRLGVNSPDFIYSFQQTLQDKVAIYSDGQIMLIDTIGVPFAASIVKNYEDLDRLWSKQFGQYLSPTDTYILRGLTDYMEYLPGYIKRVRDLVQEIANLQNNINSSTNYLQELLSELKALDSPAENSDQEDDNKDKKSKKEKKKGKSFVEKLNSVTNKLNEYAQNNGQRAQTNRNYNQSARDYGLDNRAREQQTREYQLKLKKNELRRKIELERSALGTKRENLRRLQKEFDEKKKILESISVATMEYGELSYDLEKNAFVPENSKFPAYYTFSKYGPICRLYLEPSHYVTLSPSDVINSITENGNIVTVELGGGDHIKYTKYGHFPYDVKLSRKKGYIEYVTDDSGSETKISYTFSEPENVIFYSDNSGRELGSCEITQGSKLNIQAREPEMELILSQYDPTELILKKGAVSGWIYDQNNVHTHSLDNRYSSEFTKIYWYKGAEFEQQKEQRETAEIKKKQDLILAKYGKKYGTHHVADVMKGVINVGMPWNLVKEVFVNGIYDETSYSKTYKVINNIPRFNLTDNTIEANRYGMGTLDYVTVRNGVVSNVLHTNHR